MRANVMHALQADEMCALLAQVLMRVPRAVQLGMRATRFPVSAPMSAPMRAGHVVPRGRRGLQWRVAMFATGARVPEHEMAAGSSPGRCRCHRVGPGCVPGVCRPTVAGNLRSRLLPMRRTHHSASQALQRVSEVLLD